MNETIQLEVGYRHALTAEFEKLARLSDGWLDGAGHAPPPGDLDWLGAQIVATFPAGMVLPFVCPTPTGGVFLEWNQGDWIVSAEIPLPEHRCMLQATNSQTRKTVDEECPLNVPTDFAGIYRFVGVPGDGTSLTWNAPLRARGQQAKRPRLDWR